MDAVKSLFWVLCWVQPYVLVAQGANEPDTLAQADVEGQYRTIQSQLTEAYQDPNDVALWSGEDIRSFGPGVSMTVSRDGLPSAYYQVVLPSGPVVASDLGVVDLNTLPSAGMTWTTTRHHNADRHLAMEPKPASEFHLGGNSIGSYDAWAMLRYNDEDFVQLGIKSWDLTFPYRDYLGRELTRMGNDGDQYTLGTQWTRQYGHIKWDQAVQWTSVDRGIPESTFAAYTEGARQQDERIQWLNRQSWRSNLGDWSLEQVAWRSDQFYQYPKYNLMDTNHIRGAQFNMIHRNLSGWQFKTWGRREWAQGMNKLDANQWTLGVHAETRFHRGCHDVNMALDWLQRDFQSMGYLVPKVEWKFSQKQHQLRSSVERLMRYPTMNDRFWTPGGQVDLLPELGWQVQSEWAWYRGALKSQLRVFNGYFSQGIMWVPGPFNIWRPENVYELRRMGGEMVIGGQYWTMAYRALRSVNAEGQMSPYVTPHVLRASGQMPIGKGMLRMQGLYHSATATTWSVQPTMLDPFIRLDAHWIQSWGSFKLQLSVINMLNSPYAFQLGYPMPGRHIQINLNYSIPNASS